MKKHLVFAALVAMSLGTQAFANNSVIERVYIVQQSSPCQGTVTDANGEALIGASVLVMGTTNGAMVDDDGHFTLTGVKPGSTLRISYIGYVTQEVKWEGGPLNIVLKETANDLDEVVVVGYTTQRKADLTGSVSVVKTKELQTTSDTDPMRALQGKVAGMTVTANGSPSGTGTVRIRGIGSFNSSQDPLYVIDGVATTSTLNSLNMNDIESMQVLKDAASASIYGSRAANGVIIITTKKGKKGDKVKVDFNANLTTQFYTNQSTMDLLDSKQYATAMAQAALNDGIDPVTYAANYGLNLNAASGFGIQAWNPATQSYQDYTVNGLYDGYINNSRTMMLSNTDWLKEISRVGVSQHYDLSLSNATDKSSVMFSLGYKDNQGILKYTNFNNLAARVNSSFNVNRFVTIGENLTISHTNQVDCQPLENALKMSSIVPVYEVDGETFGGPVGGMSDRHNPLRELYFNKDNSLEVWRIFGNTYIDVKPFEGLVLRSNFGVDYDAAFIHSIGKTFHSDVVNNATASTTVSQANDLKWTWTGTANYHTTIKEVHHLNLLAGMELYRQIRQDFSGYAEGFDIETLKYMWPDAATGVDRVTGNENGYALVSFFGKAEYDWKDLLLASFTIRHDGSSRFGKNNRYGTFPAATLGYRLSKHFKYDWMDDLKIRASWGQTGNQAISNTARFSLFVADYGDDRVTSTAYDLNLQGGGTLPSGFRTTQSANDNLKWETTEQWNAGLDWTFFHGKFFGSADAFVKKVKDMLISPAYLGAMGEGGASWLNGPSLQNWGMEFTAGYRGRTATGFEYNITGNLDFFRSKVTYLPETTTGSYVHTTTQNLVEAGVPYGSIVGYVCEGLYQTKEEVMACGQENARLGGLKYADLDGNGIINANDQTWIFDPVPAFSYGLNFELKYKGFDLTAFFQGVCNQDVYNNQKFQTDFWSITDPGSNKGRRNLDAWTTDNTSSTIPALTTANTADEGRASSYFVENGSYLKLRTLQFGYNLGENPLQKLHMSNARIYVSGQNLFTLKSSSLTCSDPENPNWAYPIATSFSIGIQLGF